MFGNRYFEFDEPVHWFRKIGTSASNTYVGRSQVLDTVYQLATIEPGDQVHALVGGTFVARADGRVEEGVFRLPKHIFEKSYGPMDSDAAFLARVAAAGRCREIAAEQAYKPDYGALRKKGYPELPPHMGSLDRRNEAQPSPLLGLLSAAAWEAGLPQAVEAEGGRISFLEVGSEPMSTECFLRIDLPGRQKIVVSASPDSADIWVRDWNRSFGPVLREAGDGGFGITPEFRNDVVTVIPASQAESAMRAVADFIENGLDKALETPGPAR